MNYKEIVIKLRTKLGLSQEAFADLLHVAFATVNRWEKGHTIPTGKNLIEIIELCKKNKISFLE